MSLFITRLDFPHASYYMPLWPPSSGRSRFRQAKYTVMELRHRLNRDAAVEIPSWPFSLHVAFRPRRQTKPAGETLRASRRRISMPFLLPMSRFWRNPRRQGKAEGVGHMECCHA